MDFASRGNTNAEATLYIVLDQTHGGSSLKLGSNS